MQRNATCEIKAVPTKDRLNGTLEKLLSVAFSVVSVT